ncbi:MAG: DUF1573 domain-containing protein [Candidatus Binatia bacterium]
MRRSFVAALLAIAGCVPVDTPPKAPPRLELGTTAFDFGRLPQGTPVEREFAFANRGGTDLTIIELRTACDCTATLAGGTVVAPGGSGVVRLRCETDAAHGAQRRTVTVYSDDPTQRAVVLSLSGEVALDVVAEPPQVYLGSVPAGAAALRDVTLLAGTSAIRFGAPFGDSALLAIELLDAADGAPATLRIGTAAGAPPGPFQTTVRVPTTSAQHPVLRIAVAGAISGDPAAPDAAGIAARP